MPVMRTRTHRLAWLLNVLLLSGGSLVFGLAPEAAAARAAHGGADCIASEPHWNGALESGLVAGQLAVGISVERLSTAVPRRLGGCRKWRSSRAMDRYGEGLSLS